VTAGNSSQQNDAAAAWPCRSRGPARKPRSDPDGVPCRLGGSGLWPRPDGPGAGEPRRRSRRWSL